MLKGLTFTAVKSGSKEPTVVVSCKYDETDYKTEIDDFAKCQHPKALLTTEACIDFICDNIQHADYKFNETKSKISLSLRVFQNVVIQMQLDCPETGTNNLELKIARLEKRLAVLEPYELVTSHKYPKWETLEEFKQLPDFKYFKIVENYASLIKETTKDGDHVYRNAHIIGEMYGKKYGVHAAGLGNGSLSNFNEFVKSIDICDNNNYHGAGINYYGGCPTQKDYIHGSVADRVLIETLAPEKKEELYVHFPRSVQVLVIKKHGYMAYWLNKYIDRYVKGYILFNHEMFAFRKVELVVNALSSDNTCYIDIYRSRIPDSKGIFSTPITNENGKKVSRKIYIDNFLVADIPSE